MVAIVSPAAYYEVEFFADGRIEVQTFAGGNVEEATLDEISATIIKAFDGER